MRLIVRGCVGFAAVVGLACAQSDPGLTFSMQAACLDALGTGEIAGIVDAGPLRAQLGGGSSFERTPWAEPGATHVVDHWESISDDSDFNLVDDRMLYRRQQRARVEFTVGGIPGGVRGDVWCWFIEDAESGQFWFWEEFGGARWDAEGRPQARVLVEYDAEIGPP